jgi:hypothetical protein
MRGRACRHSRARSRLLSPNDGRRDDIAAAVSAGESLVLRVAATVLALFAFAPLASWIPGGHDAPWYGLVTSEWLNGGTIVIGTSAILTLVSRRLGLWREDAFAGLVTRAHARPVLAGIVIAVAATALYSLVAYRVFSARPLHIDELAQLFQAQVFSDGLLSRPTPSHPEFFSAMHIVEIGGRTFSQFPPGGPLVLAIGALVGAPWLVGPVCGGITVGLFWFLCRTIEPRRGVSLGATLLFAFAPFAVFMSGSHMNHVSALLWATVAALALSRVVSSSQARPVAAFTAGLALGLLGATRPVDGFAFAVPAAVWLLVRAARTPSRLRDLVASGIGVGIPLGGLLLFNAATTGSAFTFGYELLWGESHALGFHTAPWGIAHTPARGVELLNLYLLRLQTYLFETPLPSLLPCLAALALGRKLSSFDRYLLVSSALLLLLYFAYWHDGFYLGPRFVYLLLPVLALWTARLPSIVRARFGSGSMPHRGVIAVYAVAGLMAAAVSIPVRVTQYSRGLQSMRYDYAAPARDANVQESVILVRESWGAQLLARLWALGIPRSDAEAFYRTIDSCVLEESLTELERARADSSASIASLLRLMGDSSRLVPSELSPDRTERVLPGRPYSVLCRRRIDEDRAGFTLFAPLLIARTGSNVYARDLHARDTLLIHTNPGKPFYLLRSQSSDPGAPLVLVPLSLDSLRQEWSAPRPEGASTP